MGARAHHHSSSRGGDGGWWRALRRPIGDDPLIVRDVRVPAGGQPRPAPELLIFDCDGVLVDSDRVALRIQARALTELGLPTSYEQCRRDFLGRGMAATVATVEGRLGRPLPDGWLDALDAEVEVAFADELEPVAGVEAALDALTGYPQCVASGSTHERLTLSLGLTGLADRFAGRVFSAADVSRPKPAPDLFLHAARQLGTPAARCLVVEDSPPGVAAARAAGMTVLAYAAETPAAELAHAHARFTDMSELPALVAARSADRAATA